MADTPPLVLVVDDNDASRFAKTQTLRRAGFMVHEAQTGYSGFAEAQRLKPDVVILDVNLPDVSGLEISRRLRESPGELSVLPILHVSNTAVTTADRILGLEQGADAYLTEPVEGSILVATVKALLRARRAEAALAGALERERHARGIAEEASRLKDDFIATLSHELRTPLNALMGWIYQLRHSTLDERARERALDSLERNARVQAQLIDDLLDISRISKGKLRLRIQIVDLHEIVADVADTVRGAAAKKHLALTVTASTPAVVLGDRSRLQQVVTNLLSNAIQYTPQHGAIGVRLTSDRDRALLEVSDTGSGIDPDFLPHVFDAFRQGEGGARRSHGGLGLGLSVVRQLLDLHGGSVSVASAGLGLGSTFTVTMPIDDGHGAPASDDDPAILTGCRVLIAHPQGEEVAAILEASGAQPTVVPAAEVDAHLAVDQFDAVVLDPVAAARVKIARSCVATTLAEPPGELVRKVARALVAR